MHEISNVFANELNNWRSAHGLSGSDLANLLGLSKQMVSDVLCGKRQFSAETAFRVVNILNKFQGFQPMNRKNELEALDLVNAAVIARHAGKAKIKYFQSGFGLSEDGFVPREGQSEPDLAENVAQLIRDGRVKEAQDLLDQLNRGTKIIGSVAEKAKPNVAGVTQAPVHVFACKNANGGRFDNQPVVKNFSSKFIEAAKNDLKSAQREKIAKSYEKKNRGLFESKLQTA